ncbi:TIGR00645 family protein [Cellulomonas sp. S1-8]|uniref:TIGR00645 family protein n=1 Tax=Cellulomonas sp. S1-8 TaxID=2904790 RepID=UPI002243B24F|nr:TIGR00645 family protein [Cellulomonas sp. S1-8]UZN04284.1 TIGR00645 family protein [Cellulomonas sp. S1-8]
MTSTPPPITEPAPAGRSYRQSVSSLIFFSRWLQLPLYLGLIVAQVVYVWQFMKEVWHLIDFAVFGHEVEAMAEFGTEATTMLIVLGLVDVVMISNLLIMVIIGGYETFVSRMRLDGHPDQPEWLSHVNANVLKTKLAMSIIGISSIHLLRTFIESSVGHVSAETMMWQTIIHVAFVASALALAWIDRMSAGTVQHAAPAPPAPAPAAAP